MKRRTELLPPLAPPPSSRYSGCPVVARHLGGCLLARAPDLFFDESGCLYEPDFGSLFAVLDAPLIPVSSVPLVLPWEFMVINGFILHRPPSVVFKAYKKQDVALQKAMNCALFGDYDSIEHYI